MPAAETDARPPRAAFGRKASGYERHARVQAEAARRLAPWLPDDADRRRCLELGAGTGLMTRHLAGRCAWLEVGDIAHEMLERCRRHAPGARFRVRDAWAPPPDPGRWDLVVSCSLLQWAPEPVECLRHWRSLLAPGGRMLAAFFAHPSLPELGRLMGGESPVRWREPEAWSAAAAAAGLRVRRIAAETERFHHPDALAFWRALHGTGATVPRRKSPAALRRLLREYDRRFTGPDGVVATWTFCRADMEPA